MIAGLSGLETAGLRAALNACYDNLSLTARPAGRELAVGNE